MGLSLIFIPSPSFAIVDKSINSTNSWNFIALGDSRQHTGEWDSANNKMTHENASNPIRAALITSVVENNPELEFILHTGDMVMAGGEQGDWDRYFEDIENATKENITFYYAVGNHEIYTYQISEHQYGPYDKNFSTYLANVELPGNERYYSFDYMDQIHFVVINTEEEWSNDFKITNDQYNWLINDLETNTIDFIVAMFHRPCYSVRDSGRVSDARRVRTVLEPIFKQYGVDLVFSGHDHYYYRTERSGTTYVTTGGAGANLYGKGDTSDWKDGDVHFSEYHYCNVTVSENNGNIVVDIDVLLFDETDHTTTIGDSFQVTNIPPATTTTTTTTTSQKTSFPLFTWVLGLVTILLIYKRKYR